MLARQLTSLMTALALSGAPAAMSACLMLCVSEASASAASSHEVSANIDALPKTAVVTSGHEHHGGDMPPEHASQTLHDESRGPTAHVAAVCGDCCSDAQMALVTGLRAERAGHQALSLAPSVTLLPSLDVTVPWSAASPPGPPVPAPPAAPLPLRI